MKYKIGKWLMALNFGSNPESINDWFEVEIIDATEDARFTQPIYTTNHDTHSESKLFTRPEFWEIIDGVKEYK